VLRGDEVLVSFERRTIGSISIPQTAPGGQRRSGLCRSSFRKYEFRGNRGLEMIAVAPDSVAAVGRGGDDFRKEPQ
jgi:hypothetical protein